MTVPEGAAAFGFGVAVAGSCSCSPQPPSRPPFAVQPSLTCNEFKLSQSSISFLLARSPKVHPWVEGADDDGGDEADEDHVDDHEGVPAELRRHRAEDMREALRHGLADAGLVAKLVQDVVDGCRRGWIQGRGPGGRPMNRENMV